MWGLSENPIDLTMASSQYDFLFCSATLVSGMHHMSELLVPVFGSLVLYWERMPRAREIATYVSNGYGVFHQTKFEFECCKMLLFMVCGARQNFHVFSLCRNPNLEDRILDFSVY